MTRVPGPSADIQDDDAVDSDTDDTTERQPASVADTMNALAVLRDWMECNVVGDSSQFDVVAQLENFIVSSRPLQQSAITDFFTKTG